MRIRIVVLLALLAAIAYQQTRPTPSRGIVLARQTSEGVSHVVRIDGQDYVPANLEPRFQVDQLEVQVEYEETGETAVTSTGVLPEIHLHFIRLPETSRAYVTN